MKERQKESIDLTQLSSKEELSKVAEICKKLNYIFSKNKGVTDKKTEESTLKK